MKGNHRIPHSACITFLTALGLIFHAGCSLTIPLPQPGGNGGGSGNDNGGGDQIEIPVVALSVSNTTPQLNEQVTFQCTVTNPPAGDSARFAFLPAPRRLVVDADTGRATFIVSDADVGTVIRFTCTAANDAGTSDPSNEVTVTATAAP